MWRNFNSSRLAGLAATAVLLAGSLAPASAAGVHGKASQRLTSQRNSALKKNPNAAAAGATANKVRGTEDVQVVADHWDGTFASLSSIASSADTKFAYGTRISLPADATPFTLTGIISLTLEYTRSGTPVGLQTGDPIEFRVYTDASGSGTFTNAQLVYTQEDTFKTVDPDNPSLDDVLYPLTTPVTVKQGDLYLIMVDRTTDTGENTGTVAPYLPTENGGTNNDDSFIARAEFATNQSAYLHLDEFFTDGPTGEFIVRAVGHVADATTPITGTFAPVDSTLPAPTNLTGASTGTGGTLSWTAPTLPPPPTPTAVTETEPNDSPTTAQTIDVNVEVTGTGKDTDPGTEEGDAGKVQDFYKFTLDTATSITVDLVEDSGKDFDLYLYPAAGPFTGDPLGVSAGSCDAHETFDAVLQPGSYVIFVVAFDNPDCSFSGNATYKLDVIAAPKVARYNIYCGVGSVTETASNLFGSVSGTTTSFPIFNSTPGAVYAVSAVIGASQGALSETATLGPCEGGPTVTDAKIKLNSKGKLTITGSGFATGSTILLNGSALASNYKIKKNGTIVKAKGPLANGGNYSDVVTSGSSYTITIITADGACSTFTGTAP